MGSTVLTMIRYCVLIFSLKSCTFIKKNNSLHNIRLKKKCSFNVKYNGHYNNTVSDSGRQPANLELGENL